MKTFRQKLLVLITILLSKFCFGQTSKEKDFIKTLKKVVTALSTRDSLTLSKYIDKKTGVYILFRIGITDTYTGSSTLGFSTAIYPIAPFYDKVKLTTLKYARLPTFDCATEKWTKTGTFVDTTRTDHLPSKIARGSKKEMAGKISSKKTGDLYNLENKSRRIIIAANKQDELIIYLSFINNKWVLTIIDKVTCDCSV